MPQAVGDAPPSDEKNGHDDAPAMALADIRPPGDDWRAALFRQGLEWLGKAANKPPARLRGFLGAQLKALQDDARELFAVLAEAEKLEVAEPMAWITRAVATRAGTSGKQAAVKDEAALRARMEAAMGGA